MHKKIKSYFLILLCCASLHTIELKSLPLKTSAIETYNKSFEFFQKTVFENPRLSFAFGAFIMLLTCIKLIFSLQKKLPEGNNPTKIEICHSSVSGRSTLKFTPPDKLEPYCYPNDLHHYEITNKYIIMRQLTKLPLISAIGKSIFNWLDLLEVIQTLLRGSSLYCIIDIKTGDIVLSLPDIQQVTISPNEKYLLIREIRRIGIMEKLMSLWKRKNPPLEKDVSCIQYRIIDILTKKTIALFNNALSVKFLNKDELEVIDSTKKICIFAPQKQTSFNPFSSKIYYMNIPTPKDLPNTPQVHFYFSNSVDKTYCLDIYSRKNSNPETIKCVKTYIQQGHYLLINTDVAEHQQLQTLRETIKFTSLTESIRQILSILQKPQFIPQIINLSTGKNIGKNLFNYLNPGICSFVSNDAIIIAEMNLSNDTILYKEFDLNSYATSTYENGNAITISTTNPYTVIDKNGALCLLKKQRLLNSLQSSLGKAQDAFDISQAELTEFTQNTEQAWIDFAQDIEIETQTAKEKFNTITQTLKEDTKTARKEAKKFFAGIVNLLNPDPFDMIPYKKRIYPSYNYTDTNKPLLLSETIQGLIIHYTKTTFPQQLVQIRNYLDKNKNTIISLFINYSNDDKNNALQSIETIYENYTPLILPSEQNKYLTTKKMKKDQKQLIIFTDEVDTQKTFSLQSANPQLIDFSFTTEQEYNKLAPFIEIKNNLIKKQS